MRCLSVDAYEALSDPSLAVGSIALAAAGMLLFAPRRTEGRLTAAVILGGLAAFSVLFALCLGYFMV
jgi:hypothetical protein